MLGGMGWLTSMSCEFSQLRAIEEVAIVYAISEESEVAHAILTVHQYGLWPKPYADVNDALCPITSWLKC